MILKVKESLRGYRYIDVETPSITRVLLSPPKTSPNFLTIPDYTDEAYNEPEAEKEFNDRFEELKKEVSNQSEYCINGEGTTIIGNYDIRYCSEVLVVYLNNPIRNANIGFTNCFVIHGETTLLNNEGRYIETLL